MGVAQVRNLTQRSSEYYGSEVGVVQTSVLVLQMRENILTRDNLVTKPWRARS